MNLNSNHIDGRLTNLTAYPTIFIAPVSILCKSILMMSLGLDSKRRRIKDENCGISEFSFSNTTMLSKSMCVGMDVPLHVITTCSKKIPNT